MRPKSQKTLKLEQDAKTYGIKINTVKSRIRRGWSRKKALTTPVKTPMKYYFERKLRTVREIAELLGVPTHSVASLIRTGRLGKTKKSTKLCQPIMVTWKKQPIRLSVLVKQLDKNYNRVYVLHIKKGWSIEEAIAGKKSKSNTKRSIRCGGRCKKK